MREYVVHHAISKPSLLENEVVKKDITREKSRPIGEHYDQLTIVIDVLET